MTGQETERVLIADDEVYIRDILFRTMSAAGYDCLTCANGAEALQALSKEVFAIALLDYRMPVISGEEVLNEIKARYPQTAVIMVTAIADISTVIKLMKAGAYDYVVKPVDLEMLLVSVNRASEKRRLLIENQNYQTHLEEKVKAQTTRIRNNLLNSVTSLALALEAKDNYTAGHSQRVASFATAIAKEIGLGPEFVEYIRFAGLVHDIGKIGTRELVLNKKEELSDEEYQHVVSHSVIGEKILKPILEDESIPQMVRHHHERYDGQGYPDGLKGDKIPLGARILAVADTYDAMTSDRPYRKAVNHEVALKELELKAGAQFDPEIVAAFSRIKEFELAFAGGEMTELKLVG